MNWLAATRFAYGADAGALPFVILFMPRTGSNLLASLLDTHPGILCHHELFLPSGPHRSLSVREGLIDLDLGTAEARDRAPYDFLRRVYSTNFDRTAVGFKLALSDPQRRVILALLLNRRVRKVVVRRDNWLQVYTSALIAERTERLIRFADGSGPKEEPRPQPVHVDPRRFRAYARKRRVAYAAVRWIARLTGQPMVEVEYAEIKEPETLTGILRFLGVEAAVPLRERTVKQNPSQLRDRIANYEEVERALRGTSYARYLSSSG